MTATEAASKRQSALLTASPTCFQSRPRANHHKIRAANSTSTINFRYLRKESEPLDDAAREALRGTPGVDFTGSQPQDIGWLPKATTVPAGGARQQRSVKIEL